MTDCELTAGSGLAAGDFSQWLTQMAAAMRGERGSEVPCGDCTACCTSSQFVHIAPDETDTLSHIPKKLLFAAPRLPRGHKLLGYDDRGHCPMLIDGACSIYAHRPRTCRTYDCRVFPAAGVELDDDDKALIAGQARRWRFSFPGENDRAEYKAVRAATAFLRDRASELPEEARPHTSTQLAALAVALSEAFLRRDERTGIAAVVDPDPQAVGVAITRLSRGSGPS